VSGRRTVAYVFHKSITEPIPRLHGLDQVRAMSGERRFFVLSFEPRGGWRMPDGRRVYDETRALLTGAGVRHVALPVLASSWLEIPVGALVLFFLVLFRGVRTIHCRSYIPALMGVLVRLVTPTRLVFDMRGLFVDEYLFDGGFREGTARLAFARWLERRLLAVSDTVVVVSEVFRRHLLERPDLSGRLRPERVRVIPNRTQLSRFDASEDLRARARSERGWGDSVVGVFVGSSNRWHRVDRAAAIAARVMRELPEVRFAAAVYPSAERAERAARAEGVPGERSEFLTLGVDETPGLLAAADFGFMLIERHVSKEVCAPIKFSEYMAAGLPTVASEAVGDISGWIEESGLGVVVDHDDDESAAKRVVEFLRSEDFRSGTARRRCREFATGRLDMAATLAEYESVYRDLDDR